MTKIIEEKNIEQTKEMVSSLGVYELRGLAREIGIKSPTTKLRETLIDEISIALATGQVAEPKQSNKGRPFKRLAHIDELLETVRPSGLQETVVFKQRGFANKQWLDKVSGVVRLTPKPHFLDTRCYAPVYISGSDVKKFGLQEGDYVCGAALENKDKSVNLKTIETINCVKAEKYKSSPRTSAPHALPTKTLQTKAGKILVGGRNALMTTKPIFVGDSEYAAIDIFAKQKQFNLLVGCNLCYEDKLKLFGKKDFILLTTDYEVCTNDAYECLADVCALVNNLSSRGESVNLVLYNIGGMLTELDKKFASAEKVDGHALETIKMIKKLMSLSFASEKNNVTILFTCDTSDAEDAIVKQDILKISNKI